MSNPPTKLIIFLKIKLSFSVYHFLCWISSSQYIWTSSPAKKFLCHYSWAWFTHPHEKPKKLWETLIKIAISNEDEKRISSSLEVWTKKDRFSYLLGHLHTSTILKLEKNLKSQSCRWGNCTMASSSAFFLPKYCSFKQK